MGQFRNLFLLLFISTKLCSQVTVNVTNPANTTPNLSSSYTSLANAVNALNTITAISGPVILTCTAGSETAPAGGYVISYLATTTASNNVKILGTGVTITASNAQSIGSFHDAIFEVLGADYLTIQGFTMVENSSNNTTGNTNNMTEWGIALSYESTTNGAQNCTIQSNTISLNRNYANTWGIYSNSTHSSTLGNTSASTPSGSNSGLKVFGNTISNVNQGIVIIGPTAAVDFNTGIDIGGSTVSTGNTITNWGTTGTFLGYSNIDPSLNCILLRNSIGYNISQNTITSSVGGHFGPTSQSAIYVPSFNSTPTGTFVNSINNNSISIQSGFGSGSINGIWCSSNNGTATSSISINNNNFTNMNHTVAASGSHSYITNNMGHFSNTINNNTFTNLSPNTTGSITFISMSASVAAGGSQTINGNNIVTSFNKTGGGGTVTGITASGSSAATVTSTWQNNNFSNMTFTGATTLTVISNTDGGAVNHNLVNNVMNNITSGSGNFIGINSNFGGLNGGFGNHINGNTITNITSSGQIIGIQIGTSGPSTVSGNSISGLSTTGGSLVIGITSATSVSCSIYKNTICNLQANHASGKVTGIAATAGSLHNMYNNKIADLRTPIANAANPINGIHATANGTVNLYYNTIYLNANSSGALFGSSALFTSAAPTLTLNNNVFANASTTTGAGLAVAFRRDINSLNGYQNASNRNDFWASTIFTDGTNTDVTLDAFKARVSPRESASVTENPPFLSTTCGNANFLKVNLTTPTFLESGGGNISGITDDFEGDSRNATTPDIGSDEFNGTPPCILTVTSSGNSGPGTLRNAVACAVNGDVITMHTNLVIINLTASLNISGKSITIKDTDTNPVIISINSDNADINISINGGVIMDNLRVRDNSTSKINAVILNDGNLTLKKTIVSGDIGSINTPIVKNQGQGITLIDGISSIRNQ